MEYQEPAFERREVCAVSSERFVCCAVTCIGTAVQPTYKVRKFCQGLTLLLPLCSDLNRDTDADC